MNYQILGDMDTPVVEVTLGAGEQIKIESDAMVYMQDVTLEAKSNSNSGGIGGFLKAAARSAVSGESMFMTTATGNVNGARIGIAPSVPGRIAELVLGQRQYRLNDGAFFACDATVSYEMKRQQLGKAAFGGTGGLFVMETMGQGKMLINSFGSIVALQVTPDRPLIIDNQHVIAWDASLNYELRMAAKGLSVLTSGEGLVNEFTGNGIVYIQTRNLPNMAHALQRFLPSSNG